MPFLYRNLVLALGEPESLLAERVAVACGCPAALIANLQIVRKGIDARQKPRVKFVYTVRFDVANQEDFWQRTAGITNLERIDDPEPEPVPRLQPGPRIIVVGSGPAGLFAAHRLTACGVPPLVLERGRPVAERLRDVQGFWARGALDPQSNVQFGEGGAGTFSDGKLTTRVRDRRIGAVLDEFIRCGAPEEIRWQAKPHIGTDRLRQVISTLRQNLERAGARFRFNSRLTDLLLQNGTVRGVVVNDAEEIPCDLLVLAPGHSARDTYAMLEHRGVRMEAKPFAVGVRVEHPQELINRIQYGMASHPQLTAADYAVTYNDPASGRGAYSFCMCPGGVVIASASESGGVVTNGMSIHARNAPSANSALVVSVRPDDFPGTSPLAGIEFQRQLEQCAFTAGGGTYRAPAQNMLAFLGQRGAPSPRSSYRPGIVAVDLAAVLPTFVTTMLRDGIQAFDRQLRGFVTGEATLIGVESRTSAPLRILRRDDCQSVTIDGLYPTGEGAGYAGGIMSAALDGYRVADAIVQRLQTAEQPKRGELS
jgi:uncharacterized FAD-dependent dehydrogenase